MRFKVDENLPPELPVLLTRCGHDASTVFDQGLRGRPDREVAEVCRSESRAVITLDVGLGDIREYPPEQYAGIIVLRLHRQSRRAVMGVCERLISVLGSEPLSGRLWVVDEHSVRIRGSPSETT
jgi:predicted nuclease of predicted toxin-antitoxin system